MDGQNLIWTLQCFEDLFFCCKPGLECQQARLVTDFGSRIRREYMVVKKLRWYNWIIKFMSFEWNVNKQRNSTTNLLVIANLQIITVIKQNFKWSSPRVFKISSRVRTSIKKRNLGVGEVWVQAHTSCVVLNKVLSFLIYKWKWKSLLL